jgi:hypothetical protein
MKRSIYTLLLVLLEKVDSWGLVRDHGEIRAHQTNMKKEEKAKAQDNTFVHDRVNDMPEAEQAL